jgi:hypothetical protein
MKPAPAQVGALPWIRPGYFFIQNFIELEKADAHFRDWRSPPSSMPAGTKLLY